MPDGCQRTYYAVLVKTITPIRTAEEESIGIDLCMPQLRFYSFARKHRVLVLHSFDNSIRPDIAGVVQRYAVLIPGVQSLQDIHVVGYCDVPF